MSRQIRLILPIAFLMIAGTLYSQDCRQQIRKLYESTRSQHSSNGYYMDYTVNIQYNGDYGMKSERLKVYGKGDKSAIQSNNYTIYQDDTEMVSIMKEQNTVFVSKKKDEYMAGKQAENMLKIQDSLLQKTQEVKCTNAKIDGTVMNKYILVPDETMRKAYKLDYYEIWVKEGDDIMTRTVVHYQEGPVKTYEIIINGFQTEYKSEVFSGKARELVFDGEILKPKYHNYKLVDATTFKSINANE